MFRALTNFGSNIITSAVKFPAAFRYTGAVQNFLTPTIPNNEQIRTVTKFSMRKGKRATVKAVVHRFFRLHWGGWIRTIAGRHKRLWTKSPSNRRALREHVLCNATQSKLLDRMVSEYWRKPKYYINDPYTPYHTREEFTITRRKPWRPEGWD